jgi:hypothetical protein
LRGIKLRIADRRPMVEEAHSRALEQLDPFSHGGYQPEPTEPVADPVVEISPSQNVIRRSLREMLLIQGRRRIET